VHEQPNRAGGAGRPIECYVWADGPLNRGCAQEDRKDVSYNAVVHSGAVVNLSVATIANIKDLGRRMDYLGDFGDRLGHSPYILGSIQPNNRLWGALNLARGMIMQAEFDGAVDLPCGGDVALVADYLMEMQVAATSISAYNPGLVGRGIWEGAETRIGAGGGGGGGA